MKKSVVAGEEIITSPTFLERPSDVHPEIKEPVSYTHLISKVASASVADTLAGKMAGVQITTADGALDAEISVRVRGGGSKIGRAHV